MRGAASAQDMSLPALPTRAASVPPYSVEPLGPRSPHWGRLPPLRLDPLVPALFTLSLAVRLVAARRLSFHVDEQFSLLGAHAVAERGLPFLPSGVPYLHGATLSYLLAPLILFGADDLSDLRALRLVSAVAGALTVIL